MPALGVRLLVAARGSTKPYVEALPRAALLFIDISGFTSLSETFCALADAGHDGAHEALEILLRSYFSQLNSIIEHNGGEVCKYAGDALLCVFDDLIDEAGGPSSLSPVSRAVEAGCIAAASDFDCSASSVVQDSLLALGISPHIIKGLHLRCKSVVCQPRETEPLCVALIGDVTICKRRELVLVGSPLEQLHSLSSHMEVGTCILPASEITLKLLGTASTVLPNGFVRVYISSLFGAFPPGKHLPPTTLPRVPRSGLSDADLASLCLEPVGIRLKANVSTEIAGLYTCTVVFVSLRLGDETDAQDSKCRACPASSAEHSFGLRDEAAPGCTVRDAASGLTPVLLPSTAPKNIVALVDQFDAACRSFQTLLRRYGGALRQAIQDDKGFVLIGIFGLPTMAQAQSANAACCAAAEFQVRRDVKIRLGGVLFRRFHSSYAGFFLSSFRQMRSQ